MATPDRWINPDAPPTTRRPAGLFTKDAATIARVMARKSVSPKGVGSAIRMVQLFLNRGGRALPPARRREIERAKRLLQAKLAARKWRTR